MGQSEYEDAILKQLYIERAKQGAVKWLLRISNSSRCGMYISMQKRQNATACLIDILDDLFYSEIHAIQDIIETWQRKECRHAEAEWKP